MTRRKDGRWQQSVTIEQGGRQITKFFYGKTKSEVLRKIAEYKEEAAKGRSFSDVADEWWAEAYEEIAYSTSRGYRAAYNRAKLYFGQKPIRSIKPVDIQRFISKFVRENHAADKTARTQLMIVGLICKHGIAYGDLDQNPAAEITVPKHLPRAPRELPSPEDIKRVKESWACTFGMFAFWALYTGLRRGELMALTWEDVDLKTRTVTVSRSLYYMGNNPHTKAPKTAAGVRSVPLLNKLFEKLEPGKGPIFPDPVKGGYLTKKHYENLWRAYMEESCVNVTPHQLRHAYATMLFENGVSPKDAQDLLGHAQLSTTEDIYTHIRDQRRALIHKQLLDVDIA